MRTLLFKLFLCPLLIALLATSQPARLYAEDNCDSVIPALVQVTSEQICREINANWACYGNTDVNSQPVDLRFRTPADRQPLPVFAEIDPQNPLGLVLFRVQATTDAAPTNMLAFGNMHVQALAEATFDIAATSEHLLCSDTPSGLVIQTEGKNSGAIKINNIEIVLGSTAFVTINRADEITVVNIEGHVAVRLRGGALRPLAPGEQVRIPQSHNPSLVVGPESSTFTTSPVLQFLANAPTGLRRVGDPNTRHPSPEAQVQPCGGEIKFGETIAAATFTLGQECLYTFTADLNNVATIRMDAARGGIDPWIDLRGPNLKLLTHNNDINENNTASLICNADLPVHPGVYTIVARAAGNDSKGPFRLQLAGQTTCTPSVPRCEVSTSALNLRSGPGRTYPVIQTIPQAAHLQVLARNDSGSWFYVQSAADGGVGWVSSDVRYVDCENGFTPPVLPAPPPPSITPGTPTGVTTPTPILSTPETLTPVPTCGISALKRRYNLSGGDDRPCPSPSETKTSPPPTQVATPTPPPGTKQPPVPAP